MRENVHPERIAELLEPQYQVMQKLWKEGNTGTLQERMARYLDRFISLVSSIKNKEVFLNYNCAVFWPPFDEIVEKSKVPDSFSALVATTEMNDFANILLSMSDSEKDMAVRQEELTTTLIARFTQKALQNYGNPIYSISSALQSILLDTELRNYPSDLLRLPYPAIYIELPEHFMIYNRESQWHPVEGAYIVEDSAYIDKSWRIVLTAKAKGDTFEMDDALFHFQMEFPEGSTVDEAVKYTFERFDNEPNRDCIVVVDGEQKVIKQGHLNEGLRDSYVKMQTRLVSIFRYIMNVLIYITSADADEIYWSASKEYRQLKARAMKAKGNKRTKLFGTLKGMPPRKRILLGKDIIIDRKRVQDDESGEGKSSVSVRSYVASYWNTYWTGKGRTKQITKLVRPHWRGPEDGPISNPRRRILK